MPLTIAESQHNVAHSAYRNWFQSNKLKINGEVVSASLRSRRYHIPPFGRDIYMTSLSGIKSAINNFSGNTGRISIPMISVGAESGIVTTLTFDKQNRTSPFASFSHVGAVQESILRFLNANLGGGVFNVSRENTPTSNPEDLELEDFSDFRNFANVYKQVKTLGALEPEFRVDGIPGMGEDFTFGLEIEVDFPNYDARVRLAEKLYDAGLSSVNTPTRWQYAARRHNPDGTVGHIESQSSWTVEFDRSVDDVDGQRGAELVSPILRNNRESWANLQIVVNILEELGAITNDYHGLHVNIGAKSFNNNPTRSFDCPISLMYLHAKYDDVIIRLSKGDRRDHRGRYYCSPIVNLLEENYNAEGDKEFSSHPHLRDSIREITLSHNLHHLSVDTSRYSVRHNNARVEFRTFDSTLSLGKIQTAVMLSASMFKKSVGESFEDIVGSDESALVIPKSGKKRENNPRRRRLDNDAWKEDSKDFRDLVSLLGLNKFNAKNLVTCYLNSRWQ